MSSGSSSSPAGSPSTIAVRPGPCDSPAVTKRKTIAPTPYSRDGASPPPLHSDESPFVQLDQPGACEHADQPAEGQEDAERQRALERRGALAEHDPDAHDRAAEERDEQRRHHRRAEVQPHGAGELHVAHAHPRGVGERGKVQNQERAGAGDQVLDEVVALHEQRGPEPPGRERVDDPVRQKPCSRSIAARALRAATNGSSSTRSSSRPRTAATVRTAATGSASLPGARRVGTGAPIVW